MADTSIGVVAADGTTKQIDTHTQPNGDNREAVVIGDPIDTTVARVLTVPPAGTDAGLAVRLVGSAPLAYAPTVARVSVTPSTTSAVAVAARAGRVWGTLRNNSSAPAFVTFGATAVAASADLRIGSGGFYEFPPDASFRITQSINVIWEAAATGALLVTEWF